MADTVVHDRRLFNITFVVLSLSWLVLLSGLMIVDVWDETNILIAVGTPPFSDHSIWENIAYVWTHHISIYRPLATSMLLLGVKWGGLDFVQLRYANALFLVLAVALFAHTLMDRFLVSVHRALFFATLALGSSGALITAGWFANFFDASCLLCIALGTFLAGRSHCILAGLVIGVSFFCKEIGVLALPFLLFFRTNNHLSTRQVATIIGLALTLAAVYGALRQSVVELGSAADVHTFSPNTYWPSTQVFLKAFWWQHAKFAPDSLQGLLGLAVSGTALLAFRSKRNMLLSGTIMLLASLAYWGQFSYQNEIVVTSNNFVGRLYLVPFVLILFLLAVDCRPVVAPLLAIPIFMGTAVTYDDHLRFQQVYAEIYHEADKRRGILLVHYPEKPLDDRFRKVRIGNYPEADLAIDPRTARLVMGQQGTRAPGLP